MAVVDHSDHPGAEAAAWLATLLLEGREPHGLAGPGAPPRIEIPLQCPGQGVEARVVGLLGVLSPPGSELVLYPVPLLAQRVEGPGDRPGGLGRPRPSLAGTSSLAHGQHLERLSSVQAVLHQGEPPVVGETGGPSVRAKGRTRRGRRVELEAECLMDRHVQIVAAGCDSAMGPISCSTHRSAFSARLRAPRRP